MTTSEYAIGRELPSGSSFFKQLLAFTRHEIRETQRVINRADSDHVLQAGAVVRDAY